MNNITTVIMIHGRKNVNITMGLFFEVHLKGKASFNNYAILIFKYNDENWAKICIDSTNSIVTCFCVRHHEQETNP